MRTGWRVLWAGMLAAGWAGCHKPETQARESQDPWLPRNVQGNWVLRDVRPPERADLFNMQAATFNSDQTYVARILKEGQRYETVRGTYRFDEWTRKLYLHSGPDRVEYGAVVWLGMELHLTGGPSRAQDATAVMVRSNLRVISETVPLERRTR